MQDSLYVSHIDSNEKLKAKIFDLLQNGMYEEITRSIGMHSLIFDPQHTIGDRDRLFRMVLSMIKEKIGKSKGKAYSSWLTAFPKLLSELIETKQEVANKSAIDIIASRISAFGPFRSVDDFYFWALDDRRLTLGQIVKYLEKTAEMHKA